MMMPLELAPNTFFLVESWYHIDSGRPLTTLMVKPRKG